MKQETIYLAGGCFWGTEHYLKTLPGVLSTRVGYAFGKKEGENRALTETVTYEEVCATPKPSRLFLTRISSPFRSFCGNMPTPSTRLHLAGRAWISASSTVPESIP